MYEYEIKDKLDKKFQNRVLFLQNTQTQFEVGLRKVHQWFLENWEKIKRSDELACGG